MSWDTFRRQAQLMRTAIAHIESTHGDHLPWQDLPEAMEVFTAPDELLAALHTFWHNTLAARIDQALENDSHHSPVSVAQAWGKLAGEYPGLRRLLDRFTDHPGLAAGLRQEYRLLAVAAGLTTMAASHDQAATAGFSMIERWRTRETPVRHQPVQVEHQPVQVQHQPMQVEVIAMPHRPGRWRTAGRGGRRSAVAVA